MGRIAGEYMKIVGKLKAFDELYKMIEETEREIMGD
jgi:hypothetical protein